MPHACAPPASEKAHHVVDLPHVDAFQRKSVALLLRDPVALSKQTREMSRRGVLKGNSVYRGDWYIAGIAGRRPLAGPSFRQHAAFIGKHAVPVLLPETLVYRHDVALCGEDVLVVGPVERVVLIEQLR